MTNLIPQRMARMTLETILLDMAERVRVGDSDEGSIEYLLPDTPPYDEVEVRGCYRTGNLDGGQGSMRMIGEPPSVLAADVDSKNERRAPFAFVYTADGQLDLASAVYQALGYASIAWSEKPRGIFDSDGARDAGEKLLAFIQEWESTHDAR
jgi:hypothetical protein